MKGRLILLFVVLPLLDLSLLLKVGQWLGALSTAALVVGTGFLGALLARRQGMAALARAGADLSSGRLPDASLLDGLSVLVGGALLLTPGVLTDILGFGLLIPVSRRLLQKLAIRFAAQRIAKGSAASPPVEVYRRSPSGGSKPLETIDKIEIHEAGR